jgi:hypothetical protein
LPFDNDRQKQSVDQWRTESLGRDRSECPDPNPDQHRQPNFKMHDVEQAV